MAEYKDKNVGFVDFYHGKRRAEGTASAPVFEGRLKITEDIKKGQEIKFAVWEKQKDGVTKDEMFSGKLVTQVVV